MFLNLFKSIQIQTLAKISKMNKIKIPISLNALPIFEVPTFEIHESEFSLLELSINRIRRQQTEALLLKLVSSIKSYHPLCNHETIEEHLPFVVTEDISESEQVYFYRPTMDKLFFLFRIKSSFSQEGFNTFKYEIEFIDTITP